MHYIIRQLADQLKEKWENPGSIGATAQWCSKLVSMYPIVGQDGTNKMQQTVIIIIQLLAIVILSMYLNMHLCIAYWQFLKAHSNQVKFHCLLLKTSEIKKNKRGKINYPVGADIMKF